MDNICCIVLISTLGGLCLIGVAGVCYGCHDVPIRTSTVTPATLYRIQKSRYDALINTPPGYQVTTPVPEYQETILAYPPVAEPIAEPLAEPIAEPFADSVPPPVYTETN
jgi:hypothetical protein